VGSYDVADADKPMTNDSVQEASTFRQIVDRNVTHKLQDL